MLVLLFFLGKKKSKQKKTNKTSFGENLLIFVYSFWKKRISTTPRSLRFLPAVKGKNKFLAKENHPFGWRVVPKRLMPYIFLVLKGIFIHREDVTLYTRTVCQKHAYPSYSDIRWGYRILFRSEQPNVLHSE